MEQPKKRKSNGCYNCMKRRITCDKSQPHCQKCIKKHIPCPGYGVRYRFAKAKGPLDTGTTSTAHTPSSSKSSAHSSSPTRDKLRWVQCYSGTGQAKSTSTSSITSSSTSHVVGSASTTRSVSVLCDTPKPTSVKGAWPYPPEGLERGSPCCTGESQQLSAHSHPEPPHVSLSTGVTLPPLLAAQDKTVRQLFDHFANHVSPAMLMFDDEANGYRYEILPLAHVDPVVRRAVCVAAAFHLSSRRPELREPAERGRGAIIRKLRETAPQSTTQLMLDERAWAVVLLLTVADLVVGHEHVMLLYRMLSCFMSSWSSSAKNARDGKPACSLGAFLYYQSHLISFFARPALAESGAVESFTQVLDAPLTSIERYAPRQRTATSTSTSPQVANMKRSALHVPGRGGVTTAKTTSSLPSTSSRSPSAAKEDSVMAYTISLHESIMRCAVEMYILRARSDDDSSPEGCCSQGQGQRRLLNQAYHDAAAARTAHLRALFERLDLSAAGAHIVVWPAFVGAAEALSQEDRDFFVAVLKRIAHETGYGNVLRGLAVLPSLWERDVRERWTATLPSLGVLVM